jgi:hypothetical protein
MISFVRLVTVGGLAVFTTATAGHSQVLRYDGDSGSVAPHTYTRAQEDHVRQMVGGQEQKVDIRSQWRFSTRVVESTPDSVTLEIVHDSIGIIGMPGGEAEDFSAIYGQPIVVVLGRRGEVRAITLPESLPAAAARLDLETTYRTFFPKLPVGTVEPGFSWVDTLNIATHQRGLDLSVQRVDTYTTRGPAGASGRDVLRIDYTTTLDLEGSGSQQGAEVSLSGSGSGSGSFTFDPNQGLYLGGSESTEVKMNAFVTVGGQYVLIPIVTTRTETVELVE